MQLFVKTLDNKTKIIQVNTENMTFYDIKKMIYGNYNINPNRYYLMFNGKILKDSDRISKFSLQNESSIYTNLRAHI